MSLCGERQTLTHLFVTCSEARLFWSLLTNCWSSKNGGRMTLHKNEIIYSVTDYFARHLGLNTMFKPTLDYNQILFIFRFKKRRRVLFRYLLSDFEQN